MNPSDPLERELIETLSAYLDGRLGGAEKAALEARLNKEEDLRRQLAALRSVRDSLRALPLYKPPRPLVLTPAMTGKPAGKPPVISPLRLALGSALASLAFVCVLSVDVFSRGAFLGAASAPRAVAPANESFSVPQQSSDMSSAGKSAATAAPAGLMPTETPSPVATPRIGTGSDNSVLTETAAAAPTTVPMLGGGCGGCSPTEGESVVPPLVATIPVATFTKPQSGPDFQTAAPYLEAFLAISAVLLAILAVWMRKSNHRKGP